MANPIYEQMMGSNDFFRNLAEFQRNLQGDPQQMIQQMLNSGRISQARYNWAVQQAQSIMAKMPKGFLR